MIVLTNVDIQPLSHVYELEDDDYIDWFVTYDSHTFHMRIFGHNPEPSVVYLSTEKVPKPFYAKNHKKKYAVKLNWFL